MGKTRLTIYVSEELKSVIETEADELNMGQAEYARKRFRAGRLLFNSSGKLNKETLADWIEDDEAAHLDPTRATDADAEGIEDEVLSLLSVDKHRAMAPSEIRKEIFGPVEAQEEQIEKTLEYLDSQDQISYNKNGEVYRDE